MYKLTPWHIAQLRKQWVAWSTVPFIWSETFWKTWTEVYFGGSR